MSVFYNALLCFDDALIVFPAEAFRRIPGAVSCGPELSLHVQRGDQISLLPP